MEQETKQRRAGDKRTRHVLYFVSVVLVIFYILVLVWGFIPKVCREYKMYYITHELVDWPGYYNLEYVYGTKEYFTELKHMTTGNYVGYDVGMRRGQGWIKTKRYDGTWNNATKSYLYYRPIEKADDASFVIQINGFEGNGVVKVMVGDTVIGSFASEGKFSFEMPELKAKKVIKITFVSDEGVKFNLWSGSIDSPDAQAVAELERQWEVRKRKLDWQKQMEIHELEKELEEN